MFPNLFYSQHMDILGILAQAGGHSDKITKAEPSTKSQGMRIYITLIFETETLV